VRTTLKDPIVWASDDGVYEVRYRKTQGRFNTYHNYSVWSVIDGTYAGITRSTLADTIEMVEGLA